MQLSYRIIIIYFRVSPKDYILLKGESNALFLFRTLAQCSTHTSTIPEILPMFKEWYLEMKGSTYIFSKAGLFCFFLMNSSIGMIYLATVEDFIFQRWPPEHVPSHMLLVHEKVTLLLSSSMAYVPSSGAWADLCDCFDRSLLNSLFVRANPVTVTDSEILGRHLGRRHHSHPQLRLHRRKRAGAFRHSGAVPTPPDSYPPLRQGLTMQHLGLD